MDIEIMVGICVPFCSVAGINEELARRGRKPVDLVLPRVPSGS